MKHPFDKVLKSRFGGLLKHGSHHPDGEACALEAATVARGNKWDDEPETAGLPDLRELNDGPWSSDEARTRALRPLVKALWTWMRWGEKRRGAWTSRVKLRFNRELGSELDDYEGIYYALQRVAWLARDDIDDADRILSLACKIMREEARR